MSGRQPLKVTPARARARNSAIAKLDARAAEPLRTLAHAVDRAVRENA